MLLTLFASLALAPQDTIEGHPYEKQATRLETEAHMLSVLRPTRVTWGSWWCVSPFDYAGHDQNALATAFSPELEMRAMRVDGPGPDFTLTHVGKNGTKATWRQLGEISGKRVDLHFFEEDELSDFVSCYLYTTITSSVAQTIEVNCGSDDGMRFWLNGRLLVDHDVPRGLDPMAEHVKLDLEPGVNHVLVKIADGVGGWDFQIEYRERIDPLIEAQLQYLLDRDFPVDATRAHYRVLTVPVPDGVVLEVGGLDFMSDGDPLVATRRGDLFRVENAYAEPPLDASFQLFASGLHEPLGVGVRVEDGHDAVYSVQRAELTKMVDVDGDGAADRYECFSDGWGVSGNYHEFAFGPEFDAEGNAWVTLNVGFCGSLGKSLVPWRGWALKITPAGEVIPVACGLRSPNGIGAWTDGAMFYVDNQGDYIATNRLSLLKQGSWHGHPSSLRWREKAGLPALAEGEVPEHQPASIWFPYRKMGQSVADVELADPAQLEGRFGPFDGQLFVGDQTLASVMRCFLEVVDGHYQGACFPFVENLQCGVNRVAFAPDGSMFVGQTDRGWGSIGGKPYGLQRIVYTGVVPFEMLSMSARPDGFELEFTKDVDARSATDPASYTVESYTYEYHPQYGAPEDDAKTYVATRVEQLGPRRVRLYLPELRAGYVHELHAAGVRSADGAPLLHDAAYYTLEKIPGASAGGNGADGGAGSADVERSDATSAPRSEVRESSAIARDATGDLPRVLFLTHSAGFVHGVVKRETPDALSYAEAALVEAAKGRFDVVPTQDCALVEPDSLATFDAVVFCTTGELPISDAGKANLIEWVGSGGAFVGVHCATDTFYEYAPYMEMIGGTFDGHPWHEQVTLSVEDAAHPAVDHLGGAWQLTDEIYQFRSFRRHPTRVLLTLDGASTDLSKGKREDRDYANAWWRDWGRGRVFYTALGHRPEVWDSGGFREHLLDGIGWALDGPDLAAPAPEQAKVLFDGTSLAGWTHRSEGEPGAWKLVDGGALEVVPGTSDLISSATFGDALVHVEFRIPSMPDASGQGRGNSGVYVHGRYEVQVLDSFGLEQGMGDCGSIYGVAVASVNACRAPERWQAYDIEFTAPRFDDAGEKTANARMTVWHNGRRIHDDVELPGPTAAGLTGELSVGPLLLQDHGNPVRYRNVWVLPR